VIHRITVLMNLIQCIAFVCLGCIWGSSFLFIKYAADQDHGFPPFTLVALRLLLASIVLVAYVLSKLFLDKSFRADMKHLCTKRKEFFSRIAVMGLLNNTIPFTLVAWAESNSYVNVGVASVLDSCIPLFAQLFGHFLLAGEALTWKRSLGLLVGFGGVLVICLEKILDVGGNADEENRGVTVAYYLMVIAATSSYAMASVYGKTRLCTTYPRSAVVTGQVLSAACYNTILSLLIDFNYPLDSFAKQPRYSFFKEADIMAWLSILYLGLVSTCIAYVLFFYLLETIGSVRQTMVGFLLPVTGLFLGILVKNEWAGVSVLYKVLEILGSVLVCTGIYFVNFLGANPVAVEDEERQKLLTDQSDVSNGISDHHPDCQPSKDVYMSV